VVAAWHHDTSKQIDYVPALTLAGDVISDKHCGDSDAAPSTQRRVYTVAGQRLVRVSQEAHRPGNLLRSTMPGMCGTLRLRGRRLHQRTVRFIMLGTKA